MEALIVRTPLDPKPIDLNFTKHLKTCQPKSKIPCKLLDPLM